jgi:hypothetical protein
MAEEDRLRLFLWSGSEPDDSDHAEHVAAAAVNDLSPNFHPPMSRVPVTFEPNGLGEATGRGLPRGGRRPVKTKRRLPFAQLLR